MSYDYVGDLAETISLLWPTNSKAISNSLSLSQFIALIQKSPRDKQKEIIKGQTSLYTSQVEKLDKSLETLQSYIDNGEIKKAQGMIGARADGVYGPKTAEAFSLWQENKKQERASLISKIERLSENNQTIIDARAEIKRLRKNAETEIADSNKLIKRLRSQVGASEKDKQNPQWGTSRSLIFNDWTL